MRFHVSYKGTKKKSNVKATNPLDLVRYEQKYYKPISPVVIRQKRKIKPLLNKPTRGWKHGTK